MALSGVLSAMRELLLDYEELPATVEARKETYREWFPELQTEEIEDLAKIPAEKIKIYTGTIFQGEASVVKNHFAATLEIVSRNWKDITGQNFDAYRFIRRMHKSRPWKDTTTNGLLENVQEHLREDIPQIGEKEPAIYDLSRFEYERLQIKRSPDETPGIRESLSRADLINFTVEELLSLIMIRSTTSKLESFSYDVVDAFHSFYKSGSLSEEIAEKTVYAAGARDREQLARWYTCDSSLFSFLSSLAPGEACTVEQLAAFFLENLTEKTQEEVFQQFILTLADLNDCGIIILIEPEA